QGARALADALNGGPAERRAWVERYIANSTQWPAEETLREVERVAEQARGFTVEEVQSRPGSIRLLGRSGSGVYARLLLGYGDSTVARFQGVGVAVVPDPRAPVRPWPAGRVSADEALREVDLHARALADADRFSGVVLVAKGDSVVYHQAFGRAERSFDVANRVDTRFNLASMGKMFTAVAIGQLVEQGKLKLTDTLANVLPEYPNREVARKITIEQLLSHTSGIGGDIFIPALRRERAKYRRPADYFPLFADEPMNFAPGTAWGYSNAGFVILGAVVEKVSGQEYFAYLREHVFAPAGMTDTGAFQLTEVVPNLAVGYTFDENDPLELEGRRNNWDFLPFMGSPAGGSYSTAPDLLRFARALRGHRLLSPEMTETLTRGRPVAGWTGRAYGLGFEVWTDSAGEARGHTGGGGRSGINSAMRMLWDGRYTVIVMANFDGTVAQDLARDITNFLARQ
ncbi:MAG TPA: serine hydrolase domain-containing protein, partial [Longimicrobium sp.]|nr:serine hydrolase domain-containing protein [Longimicrobium sp.]